MIEIKKNAKIIFLQILVFITLFMNYKIVVEQFGYLGFTNTFYTLEKSLIGILITLTMIVFTMLINNSMYNLIYNICLPLFLYGQIIFYIYNNSTISLVLYMTIPCLGIILLDKIDTKKKPLKRTAKIELNNRYNYMIILILTVILIIPFFRNINNLNINNLFLQDIYETRLGENSLGFISGYIFSPLARIILPYLLVFSIDNKRRTLFWFSSISILLIFLLNGAVKSILFGFLSCLFFLKGNHYKKTFRFLIALFSIMSMSVAIYYTLAIDIIADYIRRIFFLPAYLFQLFFTTFSNNFTHYSHTSVAKLFKVNNFEGSLTRMVGENILKNENTNANVGIFTEGYISFGVIGVIFISMLFLLLIYILKKQNIKPVYFGIIFSYLYIVNTSFIETLLVTHGFLFLLIFSHYFIPQNQEQL